MANPMKLKSIRPVYDDTVGVCVWQMPDGEFLGDEDNRILSMQGEIDDLRVEKKMQDAAKYWGGESAMLGKAVWVPGARQVSDAEWTEQQGRLEEGQIPDVAESARRLEG